MNIGVYWQIRHCDNVREHTGDAAIPKINHVAASSRCQSPAGAGFASDPAMDQFTLPRLRAHALPPIGRRRSFTCSGVVIRATATFVCALLALFAALRGPASLVSPDRGDAATLQTRASSRS